MFCPGNNELLSKLVSWWHKMVDDRVIMGKKKKIKQIKFNILNIF